MTAFKTLGASVLLLTLLSCGNNPKPITPSTVFDGKLSSLRPNEINLGTDWKASSSGDDGSAPSHDDTVAETFSKQYVNSTTKTKVFLAVMRFKTEEAAKQTYSELISSGKPPTEKVIFEGLEAHDVPGQPRRYLLSGKYWLMSSQSAPGEDHINGLRQLLKQMGLLKQP